MDKGNRKNNIVSKGNVAIETFIDGTGPGIVVLPSCGRNSGGDYDRFAETVVAAGDVSPVDMRGNENEDVSSACSSVVLSGPGMTRS